MQSKLKRNAETLFATVFLTCAIASTPVLNAATPSSKTWIVCATNSSNRDCSFKGNLAIQEAIDTAVNGDTIWIRAGTYVPENLRDIPFTDIAFKADVILRAYLVIEHKSLRLIAESGAVIDGSEGPQPQPSWSTARRSRLITS